ncbi:antibiotic biosynthesis monooxygenase family protein [Kribbella catacumbae]|uniref:antibiotic biosynthesis monooxygenase family protein n=1 Tax=Kribbella catacumbae TaxID=460086 RepID=UPI00037DE1B1|nr:antibiotic biosynthesis monooxygenase [Kribbella catacumbae]
MITLNDYAPEAPFMAQLSDSGEGPVTMVNTFVTPAGMEEEVVEVWRLDSEVMKTKPGNISQQLYRGTAGRVVTNVANWESAKDLQNAFMSPEFQELLPTYPDGSAAYPHLVRPVEVPGVCLGAPWNPPAAVAQNGQGISRESVIEYVELCPEVPLATQFGATKGGFTLLDVFVVPSGTVDQAIAAYQKTGAYLKGRPGFIQAQLYRGIGSSNILVNLAVWESVDALQDAVSDPGFPAVFAGYPAGMRCYRQALSRASVPNVCVD